MKQTFFALFVILANGAFTFLDAQTTPFIKDAALLTQLNPLQSARAMAVGGTTVALGGSFTNASTNPAGMYSKSELNLSTSFSTHRNSQKLNLIDNKTCDSTSFQYNELSQVGFTLVWSEGEEHNSFFVGLNQIGDFNQIGTVKGNYTGSICNRFLQEAQSNQITQHQSGLAVKTGAIALSGNRYVNHFTTYPNASILHESTLKENGSNYEMLIGRQSNIGNSLLIGFSLGIPLVNYNSEYTYKETDLLMSIPNFEKLSCKENYGIKGFGFVLKAGVIFKINESVRLGAAIHTPTWYRLSQTYTTKFDYTTTAGTNTANYVGSEAPDKFKYSMWTAFRYMAGIAWEWDKYAISAEVDYLNPANANFTTDAIEHLDAKIETTYQSQTCWRIGMQYNYTEQINFRAGLRKTNPILQSEKAAYWAYSLGAAWRFGNNYLLEIGWFDALNTEKSVYSTEWNGTGNVANPEVQANRKWGSAVLTLGIPINNK